MRAADDFVIIRARMEELNRGSTRTTSPVVVGASFRASAESNRDHAKNFHPDRFASEKFRHLSSAFSLLGAPSIISPIGFAGNPIGFRMRWSRKVRPSHWPNLFAR